MKLYSDTQRVILRKFMARAWPGPVLAKRRVAVVGLPRSGTSWLAKAISLSNGVSYYFEPDYCLDKQYIFKYLAAEEVDNVLHRHVSFALKGRILHQYVIGEQGFREILFHPFSDTVLVKFVHLPLCLDWMALNFPDLKVVQIVRHPVPLFLSWKQRSWDPANSLGRLLSQEKLVEGPLVQYANIMRNAKTYWEKAGAFWGAVVRMQYDQHRDGWYLYEHEWFCQDSVSRIRWLIESLGLKWNERILDFLTGKDRGQGVAGPGYGKWRDPKDEINKWKSKVTDDDLKELQSTLECFDLPFYAGLQSDVHWKGG